MHAGGDWTVAIGGNRGVFIETAKADFNQLFQVLIGEAPSDEAYAATILAIGSSGAVRTEALRAFTEDEYREIIAALP